MTRQEKYEKQDVEIVLEKLFHITDEDGNIVCVKDPPFPWDDSSQFEYLKIDYGDYLCWKINDDVESIFEECGKCIIGLNINKFLRYIAKTEISEKFKKWMEEYDDVKMFFSGDYDYPAVICIKGIRKETDEEYKKRIEIIEKRKMRREASLSKSKKRKRQKKIEEEKALLEKLKKKYESK